MIAIVGEPRPALEVRAAARLFFAHHTVHYMCSEPDGAAWCKRFTKATNTQERDGAPAAHAPT